MQRMIKYVLFAAVLLGGGLFIVTSFRAASPPPQAADSPEIARAPVRVYGVVEPAGREVFVSPPMTRRIVEIFAKEGATVVVGQPLCILENSVERAQVDLAQARVASSQKALEADLDELARAEKLYRKRIDTEYKFTQARLVMELGRKNLKVAKNELKVAKVQLEQTVLRSPVEGMVYKCDIRLGETFAAGDNTRIILGSPKLWVRLSVESFWKDRIQPGSQWSVYDTETSELLGSGRTIKRLPYMGRRDFRTEDTLERFDTKFQEYILDLETSRKNVPIGLSVVARLEQQPR